MQNIELIMAVHNIIDFINQANCRPHISEKIIKYLNIEDVVNCMKTCKAFRSFILCALEDNKKLQAHLDRTVTARAAGCDHKWRSGSAITLQSPEIVPEPYGLTYFKANIFGLDNNIWVSSACHKVNANESQNNINIYNLDGNEIDNISVKHFPKTQVIAGGNVLVNDGNVVRVLMCSNNNVRSKTVNRQLGKDHEISEDDCVYDCYSKADKGSTKCLTMFSHQNGQPNPNPRGPIVLDTYSGKEWHTFIKEVSLSLVMKGGKILQTFLG